VPANDHWQKRHCGNVSREGVTQLVAELDRPRRIAAWAIFASRFLGATSE
jgi:hypothetical protein